jgi:hypothetical protein
MGRNSADDLLLLWLAVSRSLKLRLTCVLAGPISMGLADKSDEGSRGFAVLIVSRDGIGQRERLSSLCMAFGATVLSDFPVAMDALALTRAGGWACAGSRPNCSSRRASFARQTAAKCGGRAFACAGCLFPVALVDSAFGPSEVLLKWPSNEARKRPAHRDARANLRPGV